MLFPTNNFSKVKCRNDWSDNHIKHLVDTDEIDNINKLENGKDLVRTTQINWIANIAMPDSIIMNMIDRSLALVPPTLDV